LSTPEPEAPKVGQVIVENDPRGGTVKTIVGIGVGYVYCRAGWDGSGRRSRVRVDRLRTARYSLLRDVPDA
jgi:hypothetical protein